MDERQIRRQLNDWLIDFVEKPNSLLNNWSPCPYARQARIDNKIEILFLPNETSIENFIVDNLNKLDSFDVIVFCIDQYLIDSTDLSNKVNVLNKNIMQKDYVLLEDHPNTLEILNGVTMNFKHCVLVLAQKLSKLNEASKQLSKKGYYDNWPKENLDYVVNWRNKYVDEICTNKPVEN